MLSRVALSLPFGLSQWLTKIYFRSLCWGQVGPHSIPQQLVEFKKMEVRILPALADNYMYLIVDKTTNEAAVVDPVEPESVKTAVQLGNYNLTTVLTTHHHEDHAGGNADLLKLYPGLRVFGGDDRIKKLTEKVEHDAIFRVGNLAVRCLHTPCHTSGHICYYVTAENDDSEAAVFTGDTLFLGGCGRFFEGTASQMYTALIEILGRLPDATRVFCGHEYTLQNLRFAAHMEPHNPEIPKVVAAYEEMRSKKLPTVPSTIGAEKTYNPFMRVELESLMKRVNKDDPIETMKAIRKMKDSFRG